MCGGATRAFLSSADRNRKVGSTIFDYRQCEGCGLVYLTNVPADLGPYYVGGYNQIPTSLAGLREAAKAEAYRLEPLLRVKQSGRVAEIGPWIGLFSSNARDAGFDVVAIERDATCVAFLNDVAGIEAWQTTDPAAVLAEHPESFDAIALWHSLEHLEKPWELVRAAAIALRPGGVLIMAIPNIASRQAEHLGISWLHFDAPRHVTFLPPQTMRRLCLDNGLEEVELTTADHLSDLLAYHAWHAYYRARIPFGFMRKRLSRWLAARMTAKHASWQREDGKGAGITGVYRKPG